MRGYVSVSVSWRNAGLDVLERLAVTGAGRADLAERALSAGCAEVLVLSTCSRTEVHAVTDGSATADDASAPDLLGLLTHGDPALTAAVTRAAELRHGFAAVEHLFRVATGLESRVVGEVEIQGQLRAAARGAAARSGEAHRLRDLVRAALDSATAGPTSTLQARRGLLARRAVECALVGIPPGGLEAVVVGAGTIGHQILAALAGSHCRTTMLSRHPGRGTRSGPRVRTLGGLPALLESADLVFVATSAGRHLLTRDVVGRAVAGRERPVRIVDLSVPRNVDPAVAGLPEVELLDLDVLGDAVLSASEVLALADLSRQGAENYLARLRVRRAGPLISALRSQLEEVCSSKLRSGLRRADVSDDVLAGVAASVAAAVAHRPTMLLRAAAGEDDEDLLDLLSTTFSLPAVPRSS